MKYILTVTARRKNAKRHIVQRTHEYDRLVSIAKGIDKQRYIVEIYTGNWKLVETIESRKEIDMNKYSYSVCTTGIKEYVIYFESIDDAERAYDKAAHWEYLDRVYSPFLEDNDLYIACCNDTLHDFLNELEGDLNIEEGEVEI